jgi:hypothetical protein
VYWFIVYAFIILSASDAHTNLYEFICHVNLLTIENNIKTLVFYILKLSKLLCKGFLFKICTKEMYHSVSVLLYINIAEF